VRPGIGLYIMDWPLTATCFGLSILMGINLLRVLPHYDPDEDLGREILPQTNFKWLANKNEVD
jgi:hypothetical protein